MNLNTTYLGLKLRTPLVPSASPLSEKLDNLKGMEDAGAPAVVLHSLFEEQIRSERTDLEQNLARGTNSYAEALTYFPAAREYAADPEIYLQHLSRAKESLGIPVIASLNGNTFGGWTAFSRQIEQAGADALELNFYTVPTDDDRCAEDIEQDLLTIVAAVKSQVKIPIAVKLSPYFTSLTHFARRLERHGVEGLVLFNRFYQPDIDLEASEVVPQAQLSTSTALRLPLRWVALLHGRLGISLAATSGVHRAVDALKLLMAGADVTMLCSALLRYGIGHLRTVESDMIEWMEQHEFESVEQLKGRLSQRHSPDPAAFERAQYIRAVGAFHP
ncbi:MAG: dihydroorotate dehydrogenase-like protein [Chthoniobacter sp.]|nr:dihydroorotate dehydrogenase-like protein [Chthoniobacter sp.]